MIFETAVSVILKHEGGYVNHPNDPGGETNYGISKRSYPQLDIKNLSRDEAISIYRRDYWERVAGDKLPNQIRLMMFDAAIQHGEKFAIGTLQAALGVPVTGTMGVSTFVALSAADPAKVVERIASRRLQLYTSSRNWPRFGIGWTRRLFEISFRSLAG